MVFIGLMILVVFGLVLMIWKQVGNLINDVLNMYNGMQKFIISLFECYLELVYLEIVELVIGNVKNKVLGMGELVVKGFFVFLVSLVMLGVYLILVFLLVFFLLKDK